MSINVFKVTGIYCSIDLNIKRWSLILFLSHLPSYQIALKNLLSWGAKPSDFCFVRVYNLIYFKKVNFLALK